MEHIKMRRIKQVFQDTKIDDIGEMISREFKRIRLDERIKPGMQIGITAGSRGIANIELITKRIVAEVIKRKGNPFIIPAMGSHGGATAEGQIKVLASHGITEEAVGIPIKSSMDVVELGHLDNGLPVYFDKIASGAGGIIVANRIKVHTAFKSDIESGLFKMMSVGLGNHKGATLVHRLGAKGLKDYMVEFAGVILQKAPILCGLGILENAYDETYQLMAAEPADIENVDRILLKECKKILPALPTSEIDILVVEEIGKNVSGTGMDTNIVGGIKEFKKDEYNPPKIKKIVVLNLTEETRGNALGIGLADLITKRLYDAIDFEATYANTITTTFLDRARIPIVRDTEEEALDIAMKTAWNVPGVRPRIVMIKNTLRLDELYVSEVIWEEIRNQKNIYPLGDWELLSFDVTGNMNLKL